MASNKLGILGLGSYSTLFYIKELNALHNIKQGGFSTFPFKMLNANFDEINNLLPYASNQLDGIVKSYLEELIELGVSSILVPNITLHETIDRLNLEIEIIHPIDLTLTEIQKSQHKKAMIFGTKFTMESSYIQSIFEEHNIEILMPSEKEILFIDNVRKQVYQELQTDEMVKEFNKIVAKYSKENAVVIACTELSVALSKQGKNVFDMARIQIESAVNL